MLFADKELVQRIEHAAARSLAATIASCAKDSFAIAFSSGLAAFHRYGSPLNKVAGIGFEPFDVTKLARIEQRYHARQAPVQFELAAHADPELTNVFVQRGYRFTGYEYVLGRALEAGFDAVPPPAIDVRRARSDELDAWIKTLVEASGELAGDEQHAAHDHFDRASLAQVYQDMAHTPGIECWLAFRDGKIAGGATSDTQAGVAELLGAGTLPAHRRRGVQAALLSARLAASRASGCDLAVVVTQPGSQSQRNVQRAGFSLLYARAVWQLPPR